MSGALRLAGGAKPYAALAEAGASEEFFVPAPVSEPVPEAVPVEPGVSAVGASPVEGSPASPSPVSVESSAGSVLGEEVPSVAPALALSPAFVPVVGISSASSRGSEVSSCV